METILFPVIVAMQTEGSTASRLLCGERKFNTAHVRKTAEALKLEASLQI